MHADFLVSNGAPNAEVIALNGRSETLFKAAIADAIAALDPALAKYIDDQLWYQSLRQTTYNYRSVREAILVVRHGSGGLGWETRLPVLKNGDVSRRRLKELVENYAVSRRRMQANAHARQINRERVPEEMKRWLFPTNDVGLFRYERFDQAKGVDVKIAAVLPLDRAVSLNAKIEQLLKEITP